MSNSWRNEKNWWKAPVLQGPENDYGQYDFLIEDIPDNYSEWALERAKYKCDCCGKYRHLLKESYSYFHTVDGYDYMAQYDCLPCIIKAKIYSTKYRLKKKFKSFCWNVETTFSLYKATKKTANFFKVYKMVKGWKK